MKTIRNEADRANLLERLGKLNGSEKAVWGKMNVNQMVSHLVQTGEMPFLESALDRSSFFSRSFAKPLILYVMPMPKEVKISKEVDQQFDGRKPQDFSDDKQLLADSINKLASIPENYECQKHPMFGRMNAKEWAVMVYKHINHHFTQFGV